MQMNSINQLLPLAGEEAGYPGERRRGLFQLLGAPANPDEYPLPASGYSPLAGGELEFAYSFDS